MKRAIYGLIKRVSPSTAHMLTEWHLTLIGHRYELLKQQLESAMLSTRWSGLSIEWTISAIRSGPTQDRRLAFVSVLPPAATGIATCSLRSWLGSAEKVDVFCPTSDDDWFFSLADRLHKQSEGACRLFDVRALLLALHHNRYTAIVIALGNSNHHQYVFEVLGKIRAAGHSDSTVLYVHDPCLLHLIHDAVGKPPAEFIAMMERIYGRPITVDAIPFDKYRLSEVLVDQGALGIRFFYDRFGVRRYLVNSATAAELCRQDLHGLPATVQQVFHPVALPEGWRPPAARHAEDGPARPLVVGTFGRPGPDKRTELVVAAVGELGRRGVAVQLVVAGFESTYWTLSRADALKGLDVQARDAPSDYQFLDAMSGVDVAVQLREKNLGESSGVVHELLALGRSVIVSDVGSFREFGEAVRTVPADASPAVLADAILHTWKCPVPPAAIAGYVAAHSTECFRQAIVKACNGSEAEDKTMLNGWWTGTARGRTDERAGDEDAVADPAGNAPDPRHRFIAKVAKDKSFIDIGGLYLGTFERVSVAHKAGARSLALMDVEAPECPWWAQVQERLAGMGVKDCAFISGDVLTHELPTYDVVFSSGVLYHLPSPLTYLDRLRQITGEYCILTSSTVPVKLIVDRRELHIPSSSVIFVPALDGAEKEIVVEWYRRRGRGNIADAEERFGGHRNLANYYPNWFLPTVAALRRMAISAGFAIVDEAPVEPEDLSHCLLLRPA